MGEVLLWFQNIPAKTEPNMSLSSSSSSGLMCDCWRKCVSVHVLSANVCVCVCVCVCVEGDGEERVSD